VGRCAGPGLGDDLHRSPQQGSSPLQG
jgi:hypothetical protein